MKNKCGILLVELTGFFPFMISLITRSKYNHTAFYVGGYVYGVFGDNGDQPDIEVEELGQYLNKYSIRIYPMEEYINQDKALNYLIKKQSIISYNWWRSLSWPLSFLGYDQKKSYKWNCVDLVYQVLKDQSIEYYKGNNISPGKLNSILFKELKSSKIKSIKGY